MTSTRGRRKCSEVAVELLVIETIRFYSQQQTGPAAAAALEAIGFRVGRQLSERYTKDRGRLGETLEVIKFICKEFWQAVFKKQVDNLKTNHRGIYVLQDNNFRWLQRLAPVKPLPEKEREEYLKQAAQLQLHLPCGIIRGVSCTVEADASKLPGCSFTLKISS